MLPAFCTISSIFETVDSENSFVTLTVISPVLFTYPLSISSPIFFSEGMDSPVNADVSKVELPSVIIPSKGTFSPGFTTIKSFIRISSGDTFSITSLFFKLA